MATGYCCCNNCPVEVSFLGLMAQKVGFDIDLSFFDGIVLLAMYTYAPEISAVCWILFGRQESYDI